MKNAFFCTLFIFLAFSCGGSDDDPTEEPLEDPVAEEDGGVADPVDPTDNFTITEDGNVKRDTYVILPNDSKLKAEDLTVSSLFSDDVINDNHKSEIELFNESSFELLFAKDKEGEILMLSYVNPISKEPLVITAETTAVALVMMHPWTFEMSAETKLEAVDKIRQTPGFEELRISVEEQIATGTLDVAKNEALFNLLNQFQTNLAAKEEVNVEPLKFTLEDGKVTVLNYRSSASYGVGIYDGNDVFIEHKLSAGLNKSRYLESGFSTGGETDNLKATFNIPSDGQWTMKATSGLSFDGTLQNQQAAFYNTGQLTLGVIGIFSDRLKKLIKNADCILSLGGNVFDGQSESSQISDRLKLFKDGKISGAYLAYDVFFYVADRIASIFSIIEDCSGVDTDKYGVNFKGLGKILSFWTNIKSAFDTGALFGDWLLYDKEIEFCFIKDGDELRDCVYLTVNGDLDFGDIGVNRKSRYKVEILNETDKEITLYGVYTQPEEGPTGQSEFFRVEYPSAGDWPLTIPPQGSFEMELSCAPKEIREYTTEVSFYINPDFDDGLHGQDSSLRMEAVANAIMNRVSVTHNLPQTLPRSEDEVSFDVAITNNSPDDLKLAWIREEIEEGRPTISKRLEPPVDFIIPKDGTRTVTMKAEAEYVHAYSGTFVVEFFHENGTGTGWLPPEDIEGNTVVYRTDSTGDPVTTTTNTINFGEINTASSKSSAFYLSKETFDPINISISLPNGFDVEGGSSFLMDSDYMNIPKNVQINFRPTEERPYNGNIVISNDYNNSEIIIPVSGTGVN